MGMFGSFPISASSLDQFFPLASQHRITWKLEVTLSLVEFKQPAATHLYTMLGLTAGYATTCMGAPSSISLPYICTGYGILEPRVTTYPDCAPFQPQQDVTDPDKKQKNEALGLQPKRAVRIL